MVNEDHPTNWRERFVNWKIYVDVRGKELYKEHGIDISFIVSIYINVFHTRKYACRLKFRLTQYA